ncbi:FAD-dependent monooxygenase [Rhizobium sp. BK376]|uniref:FAD-dependent monooxygenase n=1 Tax=Rhizobium sp. BK376 TaxID=2512149 RepID=UPI00247B09AA|nr:FAD-dependent monooxygenase [Rhizobium sp. BK376]
MAEDEILKRREEMQQILIVGAGPVGLTMAAELARYGVPVRLIDRNPEPTRTSKALVVWSRTLELMDRMGCTQAFLDKGLRAQRASMRSGGRVLGHTDFDEIASAYNYALMIPQSDTESLLTAHLSSFGVTVERQVELISFADGGDHMEATLRHADGRQENVKTPWLIGCDGAHSAVRHGLGVEFRGSAQGDDWMLADVRLEGDAAPAADEISTYLHRDGPFVIFPIPGGRVRVIATVGKTDPTHPRPDPTLADVQSMIDSRAGGGFRPTDPVWLSNFRINERKVSDYRRGRAFLAGDAAHVHSPAGGQGMNTGMQDAINLAWKLAMVMREQADSSLLDSYSPERTVVGDMVLRNATLLTDIGTLSNPAAQALRNLAFHTLLGFQMVRNKMAATMSEIEIEYTRSPLSHGRGAGARLAPEQYAGAPPGAGSEPRFVLYATDGKKGAELTARYPHLLAADPRTPPHEETLLIVRPDGYIGLSTREDGWEEAENYLAGLAARPAV